MFKKGSCCFEPNTKVLMYDGTSRNIQNIKKGEYVLGCDGKRKKVLDTFHDYDDMFEVTSKSSSYLKKDVKYVVNSRHYLILANKKGEKFKIKVNDYLKMGKRWRRQHFLFKNDLELQFPTRETEDPYDMGSELIKDYKSDSIPQYFKVNNRPSRFEILSGMLAYGGEVIDERVYIYHPSYSLCKDIQWVARSLGLTAKIRKVSDDTNKNIISDDYQVIIFGTNICEITFIFSKEAEHQKMFKYSNFYKCNIKHIGEGEYYGISVQDDLFLLDSFDVVGN